MIYTKEQLKALIDNLDDNKEYELKEHKPKRSIQANNYFWRLLGDLCFELDLNVLDEYRKRDIKIKLTLIMAKLKAGISLEPFEIKLVYKIIKRNKKNVLQKLKKENGKFKQK